MRFRIYEAAREIHLMSTEYKGARQNKSVGKVRLEPLQLKPNKQVRFKSPDPVCSNSKLTQKSGSFQIRKNKKNSSKLSHTFSMPNYIAKISEDFPLNLKRSQSNYKESPKRQTNVKYDKSPTFPSINKPIFDLQLSFSKVNPF